MALNSIKLPVDTCFIFRHLQIRMPPRKRWTWTCSKM